MGTDYTGNYEVARHDDMTIMLKQKYKYELNMLMCYILLQNNSPKQP